MLGTSTTMLIATLDSFSWYLTSQETPQNMQESQVKEKVLGTL